MKYTTERWEPAVLHAELIAGSLADIVINGHGPNAFDVTTSDDVAADVICLAHIAKTDLQHDTDVDELDKDSLISVQLNSGGRNIDKAVALTILDEINALRAEHALPARTVAQFKTAVRNKL